MTGLPALRFATVKDASAIAEVHVRSWQGAYRGQLPDEFLGNLSVKDRAAMWNFQLSNSDPVVVVAEDDGDVVGFVAVGPSRDDDASGDTGEFYAIYVLPDYWNEGVGRALHDAALDQLSERGFTYVTLWVLTTNHRTRSIYQRWDGVPMGR